MRAYATAMLLLTSCATELYDPTQLHVGDAVDGATDATALPDEDIPFDAALTRDLAPIDSAPFDLAPIDLAPIDLAKVPPCVANACGPRRCGWSCAGCTFGVGTQAEAPLSSTPWWIAVGDVDEDGNADVIASTGAGTPPMGELSLLLGRGDGTLSKPTAVTVDRLSGESDLVVADFNHDGHVDVAVIAQEDNYTPEIQVLLGRGDGTFSSPTRIPFDTAYYQVYGLQAGDIDGDGNLDLAVLDSMALDGELSAFLGDGHGGFLRQTPIPVAAAPYFDNLVLRDLDCNGRADAALTTRSAGNALLVFKGGSGGTFANPVTTMLPEMSALRVAFGDLNSDGIPDGVAVVGGDGYVPLVGIGDGTFSVGTEDHLGTMQPARSTAIADLDGDARGDAVLVADRVYFVRGHGDGTLAAPVSIPVANPSALAVSIADMNGDGALDFVVGEDGLGTPAGIDVLLNATK